MNRILAALIFAMTPTLMLADPPKEDVHRPYKESNQWYAQVDLGMNFSFLKFDPGFRRLTPGEGPNSMFKSADGIGVIAGATLGYKVSNDFSLSLSAAYDSRRVRRSGVAQDTCVMVDLETGETDAMLEDVRKEYNVNADYLSVSLLGNVRVDDAFFFAGPTASLPIAHSVGETDRIVDETSDCYYLFDTPSASKTVSGETRAKDNLDKRYSLKLGAGYEIHVAPGISIVPQLAYDLNFSDMLKDDEMLTAHTPDGSVAGSATIARSMRLSSLQATVGLRINL